VSPSSQRSRPGSNTCIEKINERRTSKGSTVFNKGDYAISVEWFHRVDTDAMGLSFSKWIPDEDEDDSEMPSILNSTELRAVEGQPIDLTSTDSLALSIISAKQIEPALVPPPPPLSQKSSRVAARVAAQSGPKATRGARVKGRGGRRCAGAGRSAIAAAGCRGRGACGSGCGRTRAVLVRPFH